MAGKPAKASKPKPKAAGTFNMVLGIHSNLTGDTDDYTDGHAWLTIDYGGQTGYYGLWPDDHPMIVANGESNGAKSDVRIGYEKGYKPAASRYYKLSEAQAKHFVKLLDANAGWRLTNTCASWASEVVYAVVGEDVDADDNFGFETPRELGRNILLLEKKDPTSKLNPKKVQKNPASTAQSSKKKPKAMKKKGGK